MIWTIIHEDENGEPLEEMLGDFEKVDSPQFKLLHYIEPYGDTVFNALQIDDLIKDFELLKSLSSHKSNIDQIILMARQCKSDVHTYLKFYGD